MTLLDPRPSARSELREMPFVWVVHAGYNQLIIFRRRSADVGSWAWAVGRANWRHLRQVVHNPHSSRRRSCDSVVDSCMPGVTLSVLSGDVAVMLQSIMHNTTYRKCFAAQPHLLQWVFVSVMLMLVQLFHQWLASAENTVVNRFWNSLIWILTASGCFRLCIISLFILWKDTMISEVNFVCAIFGYIITMLMHNNNNNL